jgi:hypothetical protein
MSEQTTPPEIGPESPGKISSDEARPLPYSAYPRARDVSQHGIQPLPASLPLVDFARAAPHRSTRYSTVVAPDLTPAQMLQMAWVIAAGFARREPQARHLRPPKHPPAGLMEVRHTDPFGTDSFGSWDTETQMYWIVRLTALTDPTSSGDAIEVNEDTLVQSLAILDGQGRVVGAAFNETMPPFDVEPPFREDDLLLDTVVSVWEPVYGALGAQDAEALTALRAVPGVQGGVRPGQGQPPHLDCPLRRSSERGHLRARGRGRGALPVARIRICGHRGYQPVDGGGLRGLGRGARTLPSVQG